MGQKLEQLTYTPLCCYFSSFILQMFPKQFTLCLVLFIWTFLILSYMTQTNHSFVNALTCAEWRSWIHIAFQQYLWMSWGTHFSWQLSVMCAIPSQGMSSQSQPMKFGENCYLIFPILWLAPHNVNDSGIPSVWDIAVMNHIQIVPVGSTLLEDMWCV